MISLYNFSSIRIQITASVRIRHLIKTEKPSVIHITSLCQESMTGSSSRHIWGGITNENIAGKPVGNTLVLTEKRFYIVLIGACGRVTCVMLYEAALPELLVSGLRWGGRDQKAKCLLPVHWLQHLSVTSTCAHAIAPRTRRSWQCPPESYPRGPVWKARTEISIVKGQPKFNEKARNSLEKEAWPFLNGEGNNLRSMQWNSSLKLERPLPLRWVKE